MYAGWNKSMGRYIVQYGVVSSKAMIEYRARIGQGNSYIHYEYVVRKVLRIISICQQPI